VAVLAVIVGGGIWWCKESIPESEIIKIEKEEMIEFVETPFSEISEENIKKLKLDEELVFLNPHKTEDSTIVFYKYYPMGEMDTETGEVNYYKHKDNFYKIADVSVWQDRRGDGLYSAELSIFNAQKNEYEIIAPAPIFKTLDDSIVGGNNILGYKDNLIILSSGWLRFGCCSEIYDDTIFIYSPASNKYKTKKIYYEHLFYYDSKIEEQKGFYDNTANSNYSLLSRDNNLYLKANKEYYYLIKRDSERNDYSQLSFPGLISAGDNLFGASVDNYYLIQDAQILEAKNEFRQVYLQKADKYNRLLENEQFNKGDWLSPLMGRTMNLIFAGEENMAWQNFDTDFVKFSKKYPLPDQEKLDPQMIKEGIENELMSKIKG